MLTSRPPPLEKLLMLIPPGKPNIMPKRDSHSIPQERPGLLTCQTMLLRMPISTSKPQPQWRRPSLLLKPQLPKLPHHSSNSTEAETLPKRELPNNLNQSHQDLNHLVPPPAHHPPTPIE